MKPLIDLGGEARPEGFTAIMQILSMMKMLPIGMEMEILILIFEVGEIPFHKSVVERIVVQSLMFELAFFLNIVILHDRDILLFFNLHFFYQFYTFINSELILSIY
jgi:hypothetical protein